MDRFAGECLQTDSFMAERERMKPQERNERVCGESPTQMLKVTHSGLKNS